jgi:hypothetical protein
MRWMRRVGLFVSSVQVYDKSMLGLGD